MTDLFVSYKAEDHPRVEPLVRALEEDGLSIWWDAKITAGQAWRETIERQLDSARCVLVVWSKRSVGPNGHFVRDEASRALRRGAYLPVCIDKVEPPLGFGETQVLSLAGWKGDRSDRRYRQVLEAALERAGKPALGAAVTEEPKFNRRAVIVGGTVAAASVAGLGALLITNRGAAASDSIAVLPFANLSGDPSQAYFSDGIAEELRSSLARIARLKVVARTSSEAVRGDDAKTAARKLDVANILTGSVRRSASTMRISAQLVDGGKGIERWSQIYDRVAGDALQIQTDIANHVAQALSIELGRNDLGRLTEGGTSNPAARDLLLRAQATFRQDDRLPTAQRTIGMIDSALALDPKYADALALKVNVLALIAGAYSETAAQWRATYAEAAAIARRAIEISPRSPGAYFVLGLILGQQLLRKMAEEQFEKGLAIPGSDGSMLSLYAIFLAEGKRSEEALHLANRAVALDPLNPEVHWSKGRVLGHARRYAEAGLALRRAIALAPVLEWARAFHAYYQLQLGNLAQAKAELASLPSDSFVYDPFRVAVAVTEGNFAESERIFARLREVSKDTAYYQQGEILALQGKKDQAIDALYKALAARDPGLGLAFADPMLDSLHGDPRYQALLKQLEFTA